VDAKLSFEALYQSREEKSSLSHTMVMKLDAQVFYTQSLKKLHHLAGGRGEILMQ